MGQIFACGGTVEKYIGDGIFAVFGVPTETAEDAGNALGCAGMMLAALDEWNSEREARGERRLAMGIGINYGPAVFGDIGSKHSPAVAVIGDTINTASRLQGLTRVLDTPLVVGDALVNAVKVGSTRAGSALLRDLQDRGEQVLRGRNAPVR